MNGKEREIGFDFLRVISAFFVVVIHVAAISVNAFATYSADWFVTAVWNISARFAVPVFFMVSGAFLLDDSHKTDIKTMFTKRIFRLFVAFAFWMPVYTVVNYFYRNVDIHDIKWFIVESFTGEYHLWFLFALAGLYLITPFLKSIANNKRLCEYFLILFIVFQLILPFLGELPKIGAFIRNWSEDITFNFAMGYSGYYVLGFYLKKYPLKGKAKLLLYIGGVLGLAYYVVSAVISSKNIGYFKIENSNNLTWYTALFSATVYSFILNLCKNRMPGKTLSKFIYTFSAYSFGIYLTHPLVLTVFKKIGFVPTLFAPILSVPIIAICATALSFGISWVLRRIPKIGKMIT